MSIKRADGVTESERYLKLLCDRTFLSLWSYPGVYRDQVSGKGTQGKEVCDLLVVFENHIIIFSDKDCQFPNSDQLELDWNRWFKRAIQKSADQVWGAERWIKQHQNRLFLDRACTSPFPIDLPDLSTARFHLIVVAHDNSRRCQQELGGSGSLIINSSVKGAAHYVGENGGVPFFVGDIDPSCTFVHILDDTSLDIVLGTLDTISDFVSYLTKKEKLIRSDTVVLAAGEEDLLAYYLKNMNEEYEHDFVIPSQVDGQITHLVFDEGHWEDFSQSPERQAQVSADRVSYAWDGLIETFSKHVVEDTQYFTTHPGVKATEPLLRFLARESRFRRRNLAAGLCGLIKSAPRDMRATRYLCSSSPQEPYYVFLTLPQFDWMTYEEYREARRSLLEACCSTVKLKFPDAQHIVGIATEPGFDNGGRSEDAMYIDATDLSEEDAARAREASEKLDILKNPNMFSVHDQEYPL
ncbi:hypothetical protein Cri9333_4834 (plasmid) [Crinalium epipsammum PCC 9333]|uniref:Uncharacterized protein n=1 Tax=Crinalium epipsammum PCC 9333 TaxID=1173022 RepID=K9W823_9CYAN|nr:hypothetical protein [Crinalium epipsammum]AFZ15600.1 hypothetical protein Cri9333_4834 [Crinalium epipsammum PCC 9333]